MLIEAALDDDKNVYYWYAGSQGKITHVDANDDVWLVDSETGNDLILPLAFLDSYEIED
jgi:hypothetical protein